ncbi:MAG: ATP-binding protein [Prolixibacteraceae bacterium]|nr:ATP-binding protein [Prolixibacteraceae bacterium]
MTNNVDILSAQLKLADDLFRQKLRPVFENYLKEIVTNHKSFVEGFKTIFYNYQKEFNNASKRNEKIVIERAFKAKMVAFIDEQLAAMSGEDARNFVSDFISFAKDHAAGLKSIVSIREQLKPYSFSFTETPLVFSRKVLFNMRFYSNFLLIKIANFFRRIRKKPLLDTKVYGKRKIPFRQMFNNFLLNEFLKKALPLENKLHVTVNKNMVAIWEYTDRLDKEFREFLFPNNSNNDGEKALEEIDFENLIEACNESLAILAADTDAIVGKLFDDFAAAADKVDGLDLSVKSFRQNKIDERNERLESIHHTQTKQWTNTQKALFDDWAVDVEINLLFYSLINEFNQMYGKVDAYIQTDLEHKLELVKLFFDTSEKNIEKASGSRKALLKTIAAEKNNVALGLIDNNLTPLVEQLTASFDPYFEALSIQANAFVQQLSDNRGFIRNKKYYEPAGDSDIKHISPKELLQFEALPAFVTEIKSLQRWVNGQLEKMRINLMGLGTVADFTLESAQIMLQADGKELEATKQAVAEGYARSLKHLANVSEIIKQLKAETHSRLTKAIARFDENIFKLKDTENLFELNLKIARIKAVERTKHYRKQFFDFFKDAVPRLKNFYDESKNKLTATIEKYKKRMGISTEKKFLSFELSEFLDQTHQTLQHLPFVYQRLFQLKPTDEDRFYVNREKELEQLAKAYENWKKDRFVTVALVGDKGSGITSLINYFLKKNKIDLPVYRTTLSNKIYQTEQYLLLMRELFDQRHFKNNAEIIEFLNNTESNTIVVVENLQHMFLKKVNGFDCMNLFFELMAHTMKKVFWVGAYTNHSWNYLNRTIHVSNYFTTEIYAEPMSRESIENIIFKRNHLSGFQIVFEADEDITASKNFQKLDEIEQQQLLRSTYFNTLRALSAGNISLAQLYWLRSTRMEGSDTIIISAIKEIDFSFIKKLSGDELFVMQALIIHDGLEIDDFSLVMNKPIIACRNLLTPLLEKGLLIKPRSKYNIHPIIFKAMAGYLTGKNFIN